MLELRIKNAVHEHVDVLQQYMSNNNTGHKTLAGMLIRILIKFFKKPVFNYALDVWFERENIKLPENEKERIEALKTILSRKFDTDLINDIVDDVIKYYKIKKSNL